MFDSNACKYNITKFLNFGSFAKFSSHEMDNIIFCEIKTLKNKFSEVTFVIYYSYSTLFKEELIDYEQEKDNEN